MAYDATLGDRAIAAIRGSEALRAALRVAWTTRAAVLLVAIFAALSFGPASGGLARENELKFDEPGLTHAFADPLLAPLARWDAAWYLRIADSGYGDSEPRAAFFPLYPCSCARWRRSPGLGQAALLVASYLVALAAFVVALTLLLSARLAELGLRLAAPTLLLVAVFPAAVFFGAPYSESLFLALAGASMRRAASAGPGPACARWARPPRTAPASCS